MIAFENHFKFFENRQSNQIASEIRLSGYHERRKAGNAGSVHEKNDEDDAENGGQHAEAAHHDVHRPLTQSFPFAFRFFSFLLVRQRGGAARRIKVVRAHVRTTLATVLRRCRKRGREAVKWVVMVGGFVGGFVVGLVKKLVL